MIIEKLEIRGFGKLQNRVIYLEPGMNVIEGENESGKSTLHTFIRCMFFGAERSRGIGARKDTYTRYEPWENPAIYGGAMEFSCGGKRFRLERNFFRGAKSASLVCLHDGEHLSVEDGDLQMLLGGVNEVIFDNTVSVGQLKSVTGRELAAELESYLANYQGGADEEISPARAVELLKEKRRKFQRSKKEYQEEQENGIGECRAKILLLEKEQEECGQKLTNAGQIVEELEREIRAERKKKEEKRNPDQEGTAPFGKIRRKWRGVAIGSAVAAAVLFVLAIILRKSEWGLIPGILAGGAAALVPMSRFLGGLPNGKKENSPVEKRSQDPLDKGHMQRLQEARGRYRQLEEEYGERSVRMDNLHQELSELEEARYEMTPMDEEIEAIDLAIQILAKTTAQMQQSVGSRLRSRMGEILRELTGGAYGSILLDEHMEVKVQTIRGPLKLYQLSRGTLEQVYLSLRMAASEVLCREEELPVILDDVFPMYDDVRLGRALEWLSDNRKQVILMTCHRREEEILSQEGIPYREGILPGVW